MYGQIPRSKALRSLPLSGGAAAYPSVRPSLNFHVATTFSRRPTRSPVLEFSNKSTGQSFVCVTNKP